MRRVGLGRATFFGGVLGFLVLALWSWSQRTEDTEPPVPELFFGAIGGFAGALAFAIAWWMSSPPPRDPIPPDSLHRTVGDGRGGPSAS